MSFMSSITRLSAEELQPLEERPLSLYGLCVDRLNHSSSEAFPYETAKFAIILVLLTSLQAVFTFAYFDSSWLLCYMEKYPAYADPIEVASFYPATYVQLGHVTEPRIDVIISIFAIALLAFGPMHSDTLETLLVVHPLDRGLLYTSPSPPDS